MKRKYQLEAILREPLELFSVVYCIFFSLLIWFFPAYFLLNKTSKSIVVGMLLYLAFQRGIEAYSLIRYKSKLLSNKVWRIGLKNVMAKNQLLIIGKGFLWNSEHTARIATCRSEYATKILKGKTSDTGGSPFLHGVGQYELSSDKLIKMTNFMRQGNTIVMGKSGCGKSAVLKYWSIQDISNGHCVIIIEPKTDPGILDVVYEAAVRSGRLKDLYIFSMANPELSDSYNPNGRFEKVSEVANRLTSKMSTSGEGLAFREFAWSYLNAIIGANNDMGESLDYENILRCAGDFEQLAQKYLIHVLSKGDPEFEQKFHFLVNDEKLREGLPKELKGYSNTILALIILFRKSSIRSMHATTVIRLLLTGKSYLEKTVQNIYPPLERLCEGGCVDILRDTSAKGRVFDWESVVKENKIVYVALDSLTDPGVSELISASMLADLTSLAGKFYNEKQRDPSFKTPDVMVYADELKEVISTEIIQFVNKARGAGFYFHGFMQSKSDPVSALGDHTAAEVFMDNFNNTFMFSVKNESSAKYLTDMVPNVSINTQTIIAGSTDRSSQDSDEDFTSNSEIRKQEKDVPLISKADILELPKGQCFASIDGGNIYKLKMPLVQIDRKITPETLAGKVRNMRREYRRSVA